MRVTLPFSCLLLGLAIAGAQTTTAAHSTTAEGMARMRIQGIDIPSIAGAPFTARVIVTWDQPLVGGGTISRTYYTLVARDAQGRVRREMRDFIPAGSNAEPPLTSFTITDPVAGTSTACSTTTMSCTSRPFTPRAALTDDSGGPLPAGGKISRESLGEQTLDDLPVVGTRESSTSTVGDGATSRVAVSTRDLWYSPDLQIDLAVVRNNPQMGQLTFIVSDLVRGDPDASQMAVPAGYQTRNP